MFVLSCGHHQNFIIVARSIPSKRDNFRINYSVRKELITLIFHLVHSLTINKLIFALLNMPTTNYSKHRLTRFLCTCVQKTCLANTCSEQFRHLHLMKVRPTGGYVLRKSFTATTFVLSLTRESIPHSKSSARICTQSCTYSVLQVV